MKRVLSVLAWRWLTPLVLALFLLGYIAVALATDEALVTLIGLVQRNLPLQALLALAPLNLGVRMVLDAVNHRRRGVLLRNGTGEPEGCFDEGQSIPPGGDLDRVATWLGSAGYLVRRGEGWLSGTKGFSLFCARLVGRAGWLLLLAGILLSLAGRVSMRLPLIEGEPFPPDLRTDGMVERIELRELENAPLLARTLAIRATMRTETGAAGRTFGLYPPARVGGAFLYPRYLGVAPRVELVSSDLNQAVSDFFLLQIYPPGREDVAEIGGTPYRVHFRLVEAQSGDPYSTGRFLFHCRVERAGTVVAEGDLPLGGTLSANGVRLGVPEARRFLVTDFVRDSGVPLIWLAMIMLPLSWLLGSALRLAGARRELLVLVAGGAPRVFSRAEGRHRLHDGVFHEALDLLSTHDISLK